MQINWQVVEAVGGVVAAAATVGTLLYGINQLRDQEVSKIISQLRDDCGQIRQLSYKLNELLNDALFTVIAQHITSALEELVADTSTPQEYIDSLENLDKSSITTVLIPSVYTLPIIQSVDEYQTQMNELAQRQSEYFPSLKRMMVAGSRILSMISEEVVSVPSRVFGEEEFYDPKEFWAATRKYAANAKNIAQARVAVTRSFADLTAIILHDGKQKDFNAAERIIAVVSERVNKAPMQELKALMLKSRQSERLTDKISEKTDDFVILLRELARANRGFLGKQSYSEIENLCRMISEESSDGSPTSASEGA